MPKWGFLWRWSSVPGKVNHPAVGLQTNGTVTVIEPLLHFGRNTLIAACESPNAYLHMHSSASHDACTAPRQIFSEMSSEWTVARQTLHVAPTINTFSVEKMKANPSTIYRGHSSPKPTRYFWPGDHFTGGSHPCLHFCPQM